MSRLVAAPMTVGELLDRGVKLFRVSVSKVWPLTLASALVGTLPSVLGHTGVFDPKTHPGLLLGLIALAYLLWLLPAIGAIRLIDDIAEQRGQLNLWTAVSGGLRYWPRAIGAFLLLGLAVGVGMILLVVPGLFLMVSLSLAIFLLALDDHGAVGSLQASYRLIEGYWWRSALILTVVMLIVFAIYLAFGALVGLGLSFSGLVASAGSNPKAAGQVLLFATLLVNMVLGALLTPLSYAVLLTMMRELQVRKSGSDLSERIAQAM